MRAYKNIWWLNRNNIRINEIKREGKKIGGGESKVNKERKRQTGNGRKKYGRTDTSEKGRKDKRKKEIKTTNQMGRTSEENK